MIEKKIPVDVGEAVRVVGAGGDVDHHLGPVVDQGGQFFAFEPSDENGHDPIAWWCQAKKEIDKLLIGPIPWLG